MTHYVWSCAVGACAVGFAASAASAVVTMQTRFLVQQTTGSGATYTVTNANTTTFLPGSRVRLTIQFRLLNTQPSTLLMNNFTATNFSVLGTGPAGGTAQRSQLFGRSAGPGSQGRGEAFGDLDGFTYPGVGAAPPGPQFRTGLHKVWRDGMTDPDEVGPLTIDQHPANGQFSGDDVLLITPIALSTAFLPDPVSFAETPWQGLYSYEFQHAGALGSKTFSFTPTTDTANPTGRFFYYIVNSINVGQSTSFNNGSVTLNFAIPAPGAAMVLGLGGLLAARRRRQA